MQAWTRATIAMLRAQFSAAATAIQRAARGHRARAVLVPRQRALRDSERRLTAQRSAKHAEERKVVPLSDAGARPESQSFERERGIKERVLGQIRARAATSIQHGWRHRLVRRAAKTAHAWPIISVMPARPVPLTLSNVDAGVVLTATEPTSEGEDESVDDESESEEDTD